jgi:endonuclease/exonuclease/phosphatase family metal-dependent hydrolase
MRVVTFNIRCDYDQDGENSFQYRKPLILRKIQKEKPDIIGFQEVLPHVAGWLKESLVEYYIVGCGRDEKLKNEQMSVAFRKDRFQLIAMETFWMSETPEAPGSRYEIQSYCPRTCTALFLQDVMTERLYYVVNTHLDHEASEARVLGMEQVLKHVKAVEIEKKHAGYSEVGVILMGDFNAYPDAKEICMMSEDEYLTDLTTGIKGTFHDFGRMEPAEKIDYIAVTKGITCSSCSTWSDCEEGVYLSDYYPVCVDIDED